MSIPDNRLDEWANPRGEIPGPALIWVKRCRELVAALREAQALADQRHVANTRHQEARHKAETESRALQARLDAVTAIHYEYPVGGYCNGCWEGGGEDGAMSWPCATYKAATQ